MTLQLPRINPGDATAPGGARAGDGARPTVAPGSVVTKTFVARAPGDNPFEFIMSDETVDRLGDVIALDGWQLGNFRKNPIALFGHDSRFVVGKWINVGVRDGALRGTLELLPAVSERLREIDSALAAGVLRAVSVGFRAIAVEPIEGSNVGGLRFTKTELVECSLVAVPANPNALAVAKALGLSSETTDLIFGASAIESRSVPTDGATAARNPDPGSIPMNLAERIQAAQANLVGLRDQLTALVGKDDMTDEDIAATEELNTRIGAAQKQLETLQRAETALAGTSEMVAGERTPGAVIRPQPRTFATARREEKPGALFFRACTAQVLAHITKQPIDRVIAERFKEEDRPNVAAMVGYIARAATVPATTTLTGWAAELVQTQIGDFFDALAPGSIYGPLSQQGLRLDLARNGSISLPTRATTPTIAGSFVAEGAPIPVRQAAFAAVVIGLKKMGVITTYTREIAEHSTPQIEAILREIIIEDTNGTIDSLLIDATAVSSIRPAGLRNGVTVTTATSGGGFAALVGDIKALVGVLVAANSLRKPVWITNPAQALAISLTQNAGGDFPFASEINGGRLQGYPLIMSTTVPAGMLILLDAADFVSVTGDDPRFEVSDQAVLHMEDTTPLAIGTAGTPPVVAAPVRSMFQTDSLALRMIIPMNWAMRRAGVVAWTQSVTW